MLKVRRYSDVCCRPLAVVINLVAVSRAILLVVVLLVT